jgi:hypothetical protein
MPDTASTSSARPSSQPARSTGIPFLRRNLPDLSKTLGFPTSSLRSPPFSVTRYRGAVSTAASRMARALICPVQKSLSRLARDVTTHRSGRSAYCKSRGPHGGSSWSFDSLVRAPYFPASSFCQRPRQPGDRSQPHRRHSERPCVCHSLRWSCRRGGLRRRRLFPVRRRRRCPGL